MFLFLTAVVAFSDKSIDSEVVSVQCRYMWVHGLLWIQKWKMVTAILQVIPHLSSTAQSIAGHGINSCNLRGWRGRQEKWWKGVWKSVYLQRKVYMSTDLQFLFRSVLCCRWMACVYCFTLQMSWRLNELKCLLRSNDSAVIHCSRSRPTVPVIQRITACESPMRVSLHGGTSNCWS